MRCINPSYIHCFVKCAQAALDKSSCYKEIVPFANSLNEKANQLLTRASLNRTVDIQKLQRDLFETGREYIKKFACKFNQHNVTTGADKNLS